VWLGTDIDNEGKNLRYNAKRMILQDSCSRYSGEEAVLHAPLKANNSYIWRRLPDLSKQVGEPELVRLTISMSTFTLRTVTQGVRMLEMETNRITRKLMDAFALQNCHA
jgi:hypothetical protein